MLFLETIDFYSQNNVNHTNTFCGQNTESSNIKAGGANSDNAL